MKSNYFKSVMLAIFMLSTLDGFSDAWIRYSDCNWFSNRYKVRVKIKKQGNWSNYCSKTDANCSGVEEECRYPPNVPGDPFGVTWARAYGKINDSEFDIAQFGGYDGIDQWIAGEDVLLKMPQFSPYPMVERMMAQSKRHVASGSKVGRIEFDYVNHIIHLYKITGSIEVESFDKANDFGAIVISVTRAVTDALGYEKEPTDEEYTRSLVWDTRCLLNNGRISMKGALNARHFTSKVDGEKMLAVMSVDHIAIPIDPSLDMKTLQVNMGVDNGNMGMGISDRFNIDNAEETVQIVDQADVAETLSFYNYPNPVVGRNTEVYFEINRTEQVQLLLCDENGLPVETVYSGTAEKNQKLQFTINLGKIRLMGYLKLILSDKVLVRKILIAP